jgi:hypothetical protein
VDSSARSGRALGHNSGGEHELVTSRSAIVRVNEGAGGAEIAPNDPVKNHGVRKYSVQGQNSKLESMQQSLMSKIYNDQKGIRANVQGVLHTIGQNERVIARPFLRIS